MKPSLRFLSSLFLVIVFGMLVSGCSQSNSVSNVQSGSITGVTMLVGNGTGQLPSSVGITVALDNSIYTTQTDSTGFWKIDNVAPGNYDVTFSKSGFGLCRSYGVTIEGPGTAYINGVSLGIAPTVAPSILNTSTMTDTLGRLLLECSMVNPAPDAYFFIDLDSTVQPGDAHFLSDVCGGLEPIGAITDSASLPNSNILGFTVSSIYAAGIKSGTKVYITASEMNPYCDSRAIDIECSGSYYDPVHNTYRLISPGPRSNVVAVTIP
jgi:hypothetical protein